MLGFLAAVLRWLLALCAEAAVEDGYQDYEEGGEESDGYEEYDFQDMRDFRQRPWAFKDRLSLGLSLSFLPVRLKLNIDSCL